MNVEEKEERYNKLKHAIFKINGLILSHSESKVINNTKLTIARARVLGLMIRDDTPINVPRLAIEMGLTRQAVGRVVNAMVADGYLQQTNNPMHQTSKLLSITAKGRKAYQNAVDSQSIASRTVPASITDEALAITYETLQILNQHFETLTKDSE